MSRNPDDRDNTVTRITSRTRVGRSSPIELTAIRGGDELLFPPDVFESASTRRTDPIEFRCLRRARHNRRTVSPEPTGPRSNFPRSNGSKIRESAKNCTSILRRRPSAFYPFFPFRQARNAVSGTRVPGRERRALRYVPLYPRVCIIRCAFRTVGLRVSIVIFERVPRYCRRERNVSRRESR